MTKLYLLNVEEYYDGTIADGEKALATTLDHILKNKPDYELVLFRATDEGGVTEVSDIKYKPLLTAYYEANGNFHDAYGENVLSMEVENAN